MKTICNCWCIAVRADWVSRFCQRHIAACGHQGLAEDGEAAAAYLAEHQAALEFASLNRRLIAARMLDCWRAEGTRLLDVHHNFLEQIRD